MNSQPKKNNKALILLLIVFVLPVAVAKLVLSFDLYQAVSWFHYELMAPFL